MFKFFVILFIFPILSWSLTFKNGEQNNTTSPSDINSSQAIKNEGEIKSFQPFDCKKLKTEYLRVNNRNDCLIIQELSNEYEGKAVVGKVDIDSNQQYAAQFGVRNIPTVLIFKNGELIDRKVGVSSKNDYSQAIDSLL